MPILSLFLCLAFSTWLVARDYLTRKTVSAAVWLPTLLLLILGSRPVSLWATGGRVVVEEMGNENGGNALDIVFFLLVLVASFLIATSRHFKWSSLLAENPAIVLFYIYFVISVSWSGDPSGSIKRIAKDIGLLFVIGVIYSEKDPLEAMRAVYFRCAAILIPLSVVFVKYFPSYSRAYTIAGGMMETGVTTQKNTLGEIVLIFSLFLVWDYFETQRLAPKKGWRRIPLDRMLLLVMGFWLLHISQSKTALVCTFVGIFLVARKGWLVSKLVNRLVFAGALSLPFLLFFSQEFASFIAPFIKALGRDMTFTGRANIWAEITPSTVNPIVGAGYWNFWGGPGGFKISEAMRTVVPNAHCGYVDIYLDGGIIGLILLFVVLVTCGARIVKYLGTHNDETRYFRVRFAFVVVAIIYNLSESTYARLGAIWFTTLLMMVDYRPMLVAARNAREMVRRSGSSRSAYQPRAVVNYSRGR